MDCDELRQILAGIKISDQQRKRLEGLIRSGKTDLFTIKRLLTPELPEHLIDVSIDIISEMSIGLP